MSQCPFPAALIGGLAACRHAQEVVRRGGSEYDCRSSEDRAACQAVYERLKAAALAEMGLEDDLTSLPHSALVKVQCGGLVALARLAGIGAGPPIADIADLRAQVTEAAGGVDGLPAESLAREIAQYRMDRRGRRHSR